jgi:GT2 family glycosyltransferase
MRVTACVVTWNSAPALAAALDSIVGQRHDLVETVVVDNASGDASRRIAAGYPDVRVIANPTNRGFAGAVNQGLALARAAGSNALLVCNPDVVLQPDYLDRAATALAADERRGAVQGRLWRLQPGMPPSAQAPPRILDTTGHLAFVTRLFRNRGEGKPDTSQYPAGEVFGVSGAVALYRIAALDDVACRGEVFDEDLFAFWEDVDLDWRLQLRGWQAWYAPDACGWHERGGAGPRRTALVERLNFSNRFLVVAKNDDLRMLARALPGVALTTALKAGELAVTVPTAFLGSFPRLGLLPRMLTKRGIVQARASVAPAEVVARWFGPFDYGEWTRTWWMRVRRQGGRPARP